MDLLNARGGRRRISWILLLMMASGSPMRAGETGSEYEVKAAFLYKFVSFVEWPEDVPALPVGICVLGQDPFGAALDQVVKGKSINGRDFVIRRLHFVDQARNCHILFVAGSEMRQLAQILARLRGSAVLTVGDAAGFCEGGGAINLVVSDDRVRLEINPAAPERARLALSSRLLGLARIVREARKGTH